MGFKVHLFAGLIGIFLIFIALNFIKIPNSTLILSCFIFLISSIFPDIDHYRSIPRKYFRIFVIVLLSLVAFYLASNFINQPELLLLALLSPFIGYYLIESLIPKHRGIMHSYGFLIVYTLAIGLGLRFFEFSEIITICASLGYLTHLVVDGIRF